MLSVENTYPTTEEILNNLNMFESVCMGETQCSPRQYRQINRQLSVGAVLTIGTHRYYKNADGKHLIWRSLDNREYDMGLVNEAHIMRDYPGFHARHSRSLGHKLVANTEIIPAPKRKGNLSVVTMLDGSTGIGPNYRIALRNAALKMQLKAKFNQSTLAMIWQRIRGAA